MDFFKQNKTMWLGIGVTVIAFIVYAMFFRNTGSDDLLIVTSAGTSDASNELIGLLLELRSLELDPALFSSNAFQSLQDFSVELVPEPLGRRNPFAPVGAPADFQEDDSLDDLSTLLEDELNALGDI